MWPNALNQPGEWFQKDEVWERYIHILLSFRKGAFQRQCNNDTDLRAIFWENRESQDTRQKIEFFIILPKHPF